MAGGDNPLRRAFRKTVPELEELRENVGSWIGQRETVSNKLISIAKDIDELQKITDITSSLTFGIQIMALMALLIPGLILVSMGMFAASTTSNLFVIAVNAYLSQQKVRDANLLLDKDHREHRQIKYQMEKIEDTVQILEPLYPGRQRNTLRGIIYTAHSARSAVEDMDEYSRTVHERLLRNLPVKMYREGNIDVITQRTLSVFTVLAEAVRFDLIGCIRRLLGDEKSKCGDEIRREVMKMNNSKETMVDFLNVIH